MLELINTKHVILQMSVPATVFMVGIAILQILIWLLKPLLVGLCRKGPNWGKFSVVSACCVCAIAVSWLVFFVWYLA